MAIRGSNALETDANNTINYRSSNWFIFGFTSFYWEVRFKLMVFNAMVYFTDNIKTKVIALRKVYDHKQASFRTINNDNFKRSLMKLSGFMRLAVFTYFLATRGTVLTWQVYLVPHLKTRHRFLISSHVKSLA